MASSSSSSCTQSPSLPSHHKNTNDDRMRLPVFQPYIAEIEVDIIEVGPSTKKHKQLVSFSDEEYIPNQPSNTPSKDVSSSEGGESDFYKLDDTRYSTTSPPSPVPYNHLPVFEK